MTQVLLYELNEVPWLVIDRYLTLRPTSKTAGVLRRSATMTTVLDDPNPLEPWRSWVTFHTGLTSDNHNSIDLGQDPSTFGGSTVWDDAVAAGKTVGLFGPLQSWPAARRPDAKFFVPDTFARSAECIPDTLTPFQQINLKLTSDNTFSADSKLSPAMLAQGALAMVRLGMSPNSADRWCSTWRENVRTRATRPVGRSFRRCRRSTSS